MPELTLKLAKPGAHVHFIGIGGISMSALAEILIRNGYTVSGSDERESALTQKLQSMNANISIGHAAKNVRGCDLIVYTAAIKPENPEMIAARELNIPIIERPTLLGEIMQEYKHAVAVTGTHGKTTTTSMVSSILISANVDPTVLIGEVLDTIGGNVRIGNSTYFVTEACEYCESFLKLYPYAGIILNIEPDHLDYFRDLNHIISAFSKFVQLIPEDGYLTVCGDDPNALEAAKKAKCHVVTFGLQNEICNWKATKISYNEYGFPCFDIEYNNKTLAPIQLNVPGAHNIYNALAAAACTASLGISINAICDGLTTYRGARRRFEVKGKYNGFTVISDYAHHPTEIKATLKAAKQYPHNRLWCVFQPHTYSRTLALMDEFVEAFTDADELVITDIYAAREPDEGKVHSKDLVNNIVHKGYRAKYIADFKDISSYIMQNATKGDIVITMGAGSIDQLGSLLLENK